jgi:hypothetical protein
MSAARMNSEPHLELGVGCEACADGKSLRAVAFKENGRAERAGSFFIGDQWVRIKIGDGAWAGAAEVVEAQRTGKCSFDAVITVEILRDGEPLILTIPAPENVALQPIGAVPNATASEPTLAEIVAASLPTDALRLVDEPPRQSAAIDASPVESAASEVGERGWPWENRDINDLQFEVRQRVGAASTHTPAAEEAWQRWRRERVGGANALGPGGGSALGSVANNYDHNDRR